MKKAASAGFGTEGGFYRVASPTIPAGSNAADASERRSLASLRVIPHIVASPADVAAKLWPLSEKDVASARLPIDTKPSGMSWQKPVQRKSRSTALRKSVYGAASS
eukprot:CAMPEP_0170416492 /NCGR_PEP_ID=MMETSP0117_2-20130122/33187_1 /TAXON_ID=400756 /ORGANISM="Durinskia baltica, Strain CSIRO CS-38" /LENGTH=105 /DNA_ID=CAMNT_0010674565 /DNA_START=238 /DNA_END=556 /DNA_ORIENTATION=-